MNDNLINEIVRNMQDQQDPEKLMEELNFIKHLLDPKTQYGLDHIKHCRTLIREKLSVLDKEFEGDALKDRIKNTQQARNLQLTIMSLLVLDRMCLLNIEAASS